MKTVDYINSLVKENEKLKSVCESHVEKIIALKLKIRKLTNTISVKNRKLSNYEHNNMSDIDQQIELENVKMELNKLNNDYVNLQNKYDEVVQQNEIFNMKPQKCKNELIKLKSDYNTLKSKYDASVKQNEEFLKFFDEIETSSDNCEE